MYVAEALSPLLRLVTFSWFMIRDSHKRNSQFPTLSRPTRQRSSAHQWAAAHRLRTADLVQHLVHFYMLFLLQYNMTIRFRINMLWRMAEAYYYLDIP